VRLTPIWIVAVVPRPRVRLPSITLPLYEAAAYGGVDRVA
jgi:hypothetical protein